MKQRILVAEGFEDIRIDEVEIAEPTGGQVLIETDCTMISPGTELSIIRGCSSKGNPQSPGYIQVGTNMTTGQRCFVFPILSESSGCHSDRKVFSPESLMFPLDDAITSADACCMRFINIGMHTFNQLNYFPESVCVFGLGPVGNLACQSAKILGCKVTGIDICDTRLAIARQCGIEDARTPATLEGCEKEYDFVIDTVCNDQTLLKSAEMLKDYRESSLVGQLRSSDTPISAIDLLNHVKQRKVLFRSGWELLNPIKRVPEHQLSTEDNLCRAAQWIKNGYYNLEPFTSEVIHATSEEAKTVYNAINDNPSENITAVIKW